MRRKGVFETCARMDYGRGHFAFVLAQIEVMMMKATRGAMEGIMDGTLFEDDGNQ